MFEFLSDLPTLDILKYHISTGKDANLRQLLTIEKKTTFLTLRGGMDLLGLSTQYLIVVEDDVSGQTDKNSNRELNMRGCSVIIRPCIFLCSRHMTVTMWHYAAKKKKIIKKV